MPRLVKPPGASRIWQREVDEGKRTKYTFDDLLWAACAEANARDMANIGQFKIANDYTLEAAQRLMSYLKAKAKAA